MTPPTGTHDLSSANGKLILNTSREGVAGMLGHDLTIEVTDWSAILTIADDPAQSQVSATIGLGSLTVVSGTGGAKPLSDKDRRDIVKNAQKSLDTGRHPNAQFTSDSVSGDWTTGATVSGTLQLHGTSQQLTTKVAYNAGTFTLTATVIQSQFGIKPYSAMLGALKLADPVELTVTASI